MTGHVELSGPDLTLRDFVGAGKAKYRLKKTIRLDFLEIKTVRIPRTIGRVYFYKRGLLCEVTFEVKKN
jgi:hypothetical protein